MKRLTATLFLLLALTPILAPVPAARADLRSYEPAVVSVLVTATTLLAADNRLRVVQLTNTGSYDVWFCDASQTPVVGSGFYLPVGSTVALTGENCPQQGLKAIANGGTSTVAVGKG